ncbi:MULTISPECIES: hypothetical protein [unclassified Leucobacter]|uniref:hypothetical protein n=1 Tax=unclassified Leucobacter TaxID=2621730 RepID=UPI00301940F5
MTRKPFKIETRPAKWRNADGTETDVVRLFGGTRSIAVDFTEIPALIAQLEQLQQDHGIQQLIDRLVIDE